MKQRISELMDNYNDDRLDLAPPPLDMDRVKAMTMARINPPKRKKGMGRTARIVLIAAALAMALSVTAYAVYQRTMADRALRVTDDRDMAYYSAVGAAGEPVETTAAPAVTATQEVTNAPTGALAETADLPRMTKNGDEGYSAVGGDVEYQAARAWEAWYWNEIRSVSFDIRNALEYDDPLYRNYGILNGTLAEELRALAEKYGLALWQDSCLTDSTEELFAILGTEPFLPCIRDDYYCNHRVFDDGGFEANFLNVTRPDGAGQVYVSVYRAMKGTFSDFFILGDAPECYTYETYVTVAGIEADLALGGDNALIFAELEDCYVTAQVHAGADGSRSEAAAVDMAALRAIADSIDYAALDKVDREAVAAAVAAEYAEDVDQDPDAYRSGRTAEKLDTLAGLGDYSLSLVNLPEGYFMTSYNVSTAEEMLNTGWAIENGGTMERADQIYAQGGSVEADRAAIYFSYSRRWADGEKTVLSNERSFETMDELGGGLSYNGCEPCEVGGFRGWVYPNYDAACPRTVVTWYDTDKELIFQLSMPETFTEEELLDLADRFAAAIADIDGPRPPADTPQQPVDAITPWRQELLDAVAVLGDMGLPALPEGYDDYSAHGYDDPKDCSVSKNYIKGRQGTALGTWLELRYSRQWADEARTRSVTQAAYEEMRDFFLREEQPPEQVTVNGWDGYLQINEAGLWVEWYDAGRDLDLHLSAGWRPEEPDAAVTPEELLALAASVTEE